MTAIDIIRGALELCGVQGAAEPVSSEDADLCLRVLNRVIKLMPTYGFSWPKLSSTNVAVTWEIGTPSTITPPADYFGVPVLDYTNAAGQGIPLVEMSKTDYDALVSPSTTALYPTHFYVAPDTTFRLYPVPTQDPLLKLGYQSVIADVTLTQTPTVSAIMQDMIEYWLADEISLKYSTPDKTRDEISKRLIEKRGHALQWAVSTAPIVFEVVDA